MVTTGKKEKKKTTTNTWKEKKDQKQPLSTDLSVHIRISTETLHRGKSVGGGKGCQNESDRDMGGGGFI